MRLLRSLALLLLTLACAALRAQTPEDTIRSYIEQVKTGGLGSVAPHMHPDELVKFREMMAPVIDLALEEKEGRAVFGRFSEPSDETKQKKLSPQEFMATFMQCLDAIMPLIAEALKNASADILGHVKEGDVSHVVLRFKSKLNGIEVEKMTVMSTKDYKGAAKMMLSGEIKQMAEAIRANAKR